MHKLYDFFRLIRILNCLLAMVGVWVGARMTWVDPVYYGPLIAAIAAFFVCAAGNVVNDIRDIEIDRIAHPGRVLVTEGLSVKFANWIAAICNLLAIISAVAVNFEVTIMVLAAIALLYGYNYGLKKVPLAGNIAVALLAALTFMTGGLAVDTVLALNLPGPIVPALFAFLLHLVREIVKDVEDIEGDRIAGYRSLPIVTGVSKSLSLAILLFLLLGFTTLVPVMMSWYGRMYEIIAIYLVVLPMLVLLIILWGNPNHKMLRIVSTGLKIGMVLGLVAFIVN